MPKLNTTIDNLEWKSNKIINATSISEDWTDTQYPSAKTLYNLIDRIHPVGSLLITSTNENPASSIGGSWELVDKSLRYQNIKLVSGVNCLTQNAVLGENSSVIINDHEIVVRLNISSSFSYLSSSTVSLFEIFLSKLGLQSIPTTYFSGITFSDTSKPATVYKMVFDTKSSPNGLTANLSSIKVLNIDGTGSAALQQSNITVVLPVSFVDMATGQENDQFFDKFYWKRIS